MFTYHRKVLSNSLESMMGLSRKHSKGRRRSPFFAQAMLHSRLILIKSYTAPVEYHIPREEKRRTLKQLALTTSQPRLRKAPGD